MSTPAPKFNLIEAAVKNVIICTRPALENVLNENNQVVTYPMRSVYTNLDSTFSEVVVSVQPGEMGMQAGLNLLSQDDVTGEYIRGFHTKNTKVLFNIKSTSDPERYYMADTLLSGIVAAYAIDPTNGLIYENIIINLLAYSGIIPEKFTFEYPPPAMPPSGGNPDSLRPESQIYTAIVTMWCDMWFSWRQPPYIQNTFRIIPTVSTSATNTGLNIGSMWPPTEVVDATLTV